jgi:hypothetical protein
MPNEKAHEAEARGPGFWKVQAMRISYDRTIAAFPRGCSTVGRSTGQQQARDVKLGSIENRFLTTDVLTRLSTLAARTNSIMHGDQKTVKQSAMSLDSFATNLEPCLTRIRVYGSIQRNAGAIPHSGNTPSRFQADSLSLVLLILRILSHTI